MSENEYVATAAAEKRLREVLEARLAPYCDEDRNGVTADNLAFMLLDGAKIEYKARSKQVLISLDLPAIAATRDPKAKAADEAPEPMEAVTVTAEPMPVPDVPPTPHIGAYQPKQFAEPDYEDVHYD